MYRKDKMMSENAYKAYQEGEKPWSKWGKREILQELRKQKVFSEERINALGRGKAQLLKELCLKYAGYHHTGAHFRKTYFYKVSMTEKEMADGIEKVDYSLKRDLFLKRTRGKVVPMRDITGEVHKRSIVLDECTFKDLDDPREDRCYLYEIRKEFK